MEDFVRRIKSVVSAKTGGKHTVFAKKAGIPTSTFQYYMNGRMPSPEHLIRIHETYSININWLLTGKGEIYINDKETVSGSCDVELLKTAIELVEDALESAGREMDPDKKAELVAAVYDLLTDNENMEIKSRFSNVINLVTKAVLQQNTG